MPIIKVLYPVVSESHLRATYEVVKMFFDGGMHTVGGSNIVFPNLQSAQFQQQLVNIETINKLMIVMLNATALNQRKDKCLMPDGSPGFEIGMDLDREIAIVIPKSTANADQSFHQALQTWDQLFAVLETQKKHLADRGIFNVELDPIPSQVNHSKLAIVTGSYRSKVTFKFKLN